MVPAHTGALQVPPVQTCPAGHILPQAAQFALVPRRVQVPPQLTCPVAQHLFAEQTGVAPWQQAAPHIVPEQPRTHTPATHAVAHGRLHPPQWALLTAVLAQTTAPATVHAVSPGAQPQLPPVHTRLPPQAMPQRPQLAALLSVFTQTLPHLVVPAGQHIPPLQLLLMPHEAPSPLAAQPMPPAAHCWHEPPQACVQQMLVDPFETQNRPARQSAALTHCWPGPLPSGGAQPSGLHTGVAPAQVCGELVHAPEALQVRTVRTAPAQVAAPQVVPTGSRRHPPWPLHSLLQASSLQRPAGSAPPAGTSWQVPCWPGSAHDLHTPLQAVLQQKPCAQMPLSQSPPLLHLPPSARLPHEPPVQTLAPTHWASLPQVDRQALPLQPLNGAQLRVCTAGHAPSRHLAAMVATLPPASHLAARQVVLLS